ncbi:MAG: hypothetical protein B7Z12_15560 [Caulobacter vibrioides]|uniref:Uncharacterized protein n=1 Tax=Caulobacter vibrioides TaxID=155892 RepID=A0A258CYH3_CAUVI|nr:MAG: hypothetical protein B7Z12_15560 [Caulobacter vibrioides]
MTKARFDAQVLQIAALVGGSLSSARFLFQDLSCEAAFYASRYRIAFCKALDSAVEAFACEYLQSSDTALAHNAACARLEAMAILRKSVR